MEAELEVVNNQNTTEVRIFWAGIFMTLLLLAVIGYFLKVDYKMAETLAMAFVAHTFGGRAAGIGLCIMHEFSFFYTVFYNFYLEVLIVCFTYSVFVLSINNYVKLRSVKFYALRLERKARVHKDLIRKYGWIGLFLFVMTPLPVTGPVIGSIIGYLLHFRTLKNFSAVLLGTMAAILLWSGFFDYLEQHLHIVQYILLAIVAFVLFSYFKSIKNWLAK